MSNRVSRIPALSILLAALALLVSACGDDGEDETSPESAAESSETTGVECEQVEQPAPKDEELAAPKAAAPTGDSVVFDTSCGSFTVALDPELMPKTAASFEYLAAEGFYDGTSFHRVAPEFVVQGGDPRGDGTGGPGYSVDEQPPRDLAYTEGVVAMAKTAAEPPGRSGSQFFVVTAPDAGLPTDYAVAGEVTDGLEVVEAIEALGTPGADGPPSQPVVVNSATVEG